MCNVLYNIFGYSLVGECGFDGILGVWFGLGGVVLGGPNNMKCYVRRADAKYVIYEYIYLKTLTKMSITFGGNGVPSTCQRPRC